MYGRRYQRKRGFKRVVVTLLTLVMLLSVCFPGLRASAEDDVSNPVVCNCGTESAIHAENCPLYVQPQGSSQPETLNCTCEAEDGVHKEGCPLYIAPVDNGDDGLDEPDNNENPESSSDNNQQGPTSDKKEEKEDTKNLKQENKDQKEETEDQKQETKNRQEENKDKKEEVKEEHKEIKNEEHSIVVAGSIPESVDLKVEKKGEKAEDGVRSVSFDISMEEDDGAEWQPGEGETIAVSVPASLLDLSDGDSFLVYHTHEGETETIGPNVVENGLMSFTTESFSEFEWATYDGRPGESGTSSSGVDPKIWWGTITQNTNTDSDSTKSSDFTADDESTANKKVYSVTIAGKTVGYGGTKSTGSELDGLNTTTVTRDEVYGTDTSATATVTVTPQPGYYVTKIIVACVDGDNATCFGCNTWGDQNAFASNFSLGDGNSNGTVSTTISRSYFAHANFQKHYVIMIAVAPIPTPLYVEYDYGNIGNYLTIDNDSPFATASGWTTANGGNIYRGTTNGEGNDGGPDTAYTQYKYTYAEEKQSEVSSWKHYANTITDVAKQAAAEAGYYFAGWEAQYYETVNPIQNSVGYYNNYIYQFSDEYGQKVSFGEGDPVNLITNVKLVAIWNPIKLNVTKTVQGIPATYAEENTYKIQVYKDGVAFGEQLTFTLSGNTSGTLVVKDSDDNPLPVTPGIYTVVEEPCASITVGNVTYRVLTSTTERTVTNSEYNSTYSLQVTNAYTDAVDDTPDVARIMIQKTFDGIPADKVPSDFIITLKNKSDGTEIQVLNKSTATISNDGLVWTWIVEQPSGEYTVEESGYDNIPGYTFVDSTGLNNSVITTPSEVSLISQYVYHPKNTTEITLTEEPKYIVVKLTGNAGSGEKIDYFVWTKDTLTSNQRSGIVSEISKISGFPGATVSNTVFFSGNQLQSDNGFTYRGGTIRYDSANKKLLFENTDQWSNLACGQYQIVKDYAEVQIKNTYSRSTTDVTVTKTVTGNQGNWDLDFSFTASLKDSDSNTVSMNGITYMIYSKDAAGNDVIESSGTINTESFTFQLRHDQKIVFDNVQIGSYMTVMETDTNYTEFYQIDSNIQVKGTTAAFTVGENGNTVAFENNLNANIDTGIASDCVPFVVMLMIVSMGTGALLLSKRRYNGKF